MSPILDSYNQSLNAISLRADDEGLISQVQPSGTLAPIKVEGRRLVLPTKEWQRKGYGEEYLPYHPGCEVMSREGTSPVIQMMQRQIKAMLAHNLVALGQGLIGVAVAKDTHKDLPLECTSFLKKLSNADESTKALFDKLIGAAVKKNRLVTVYLKNGGKFEDKKVNRSCIIRFPILEDILADQKNTNVLGVIVPKKQRPTLIALFELLVPGGDKAETYSHGTVARIAPFLTSLLTAYHKIATHFNGLIDQYATRLNIPVKMTELYDLEIIDTIHKHYIDIPPYSGNEGRSDAQPEEASETVTVAKKMATQAAPKATVVQPTRQAPVAQAPVVEPTGGKLASMADFMAATNPQPQQSFNLQQPNSQANTGFMPVNFGQQPVVGNGYAPVNFNTSGFNNGNTFAPLQGNPLGVPAWMGGGQPNVPQQPANPFLAATMTGQAGATGNLGLV